MVIRVKIIGPALTAYKAMNKALASTGQQATATSATIVKANTVAGRSYQSLANSIKMASNAGTAARTAMLQQSTAAASMSKSFAAADSASRRFASNGLKSATTSAKNFGSALSKAFDPQRASKLQWMGRQLTYNFTLPLAIAGGAATKWALDSEAAMTRLAKVYGDNTPVFNELAKTEIPALQKAFEALSSTYGVQQAQVDQIGADWAQAGSSGLALAKSVQETLQTMILGEMDASDATQALISLQAQYGLSLTATGKNVMTLSQAIDVLNMVENQTAVSMPDLLESFQRSAGAARAAGVDIQHLAAFTAALVPAAGSAANAGNALKTIFSRLLAPTKEATQVMGLMGINVKDTAWQSLTATQRLEDMAKKFQTLSTAQQAVVSSVISSRYQINKFNILMEDLASSTGTYAKALDATKDPIANFKQRQKELNTVLQSNPQKLKQVWTIIQNALIDVIIPLLPHLVMLAQSIAKVVQAFTSLDPQLQKFVVWGLVFVALMGPVMRILGAFKILLLFTVRAILLLPKALLTVGFAATQMAKLAFNAFQIIAGAAGTLLVFLARGVKETLAVTAGALRGVLAFMGGFFKSMGTTVISWFVNLNMFLLVGFGKTLKGLLSVTKSGLAILVREFALASFAMLTAMQKAFALIPAMFSAIGALASKAIVGIRYAWAALPSFAAAVTLGVARAFSGMVTAVAVVGKGMVTAFVTVFTKLPTLLVSVWSGIVAIVSRAWVAIVEMSYKAVVAIQYAFARLAVAVGVVWTAIGTGASKLWSFLVLGFATTVKYIRAILYTLPLIFSGAMKGIATGLTSGITGIVKGLGGFALRIGKFFTGIPGLIIAAITLIVVIFHDQLTKLWENIVSVFKNMGNALGGIGKGIAEMWHNIVQGILNVFGMLPKGIQNAMIAVVNIIKQAAMAVYKLFSYLNPFAHHSPSLVETVTWGMAAIRKQYASVATIGSAFRQAAGDLAAFKKATAGLQQDKFADDRKNIAAARPSALPQFDALRKDYNTLTTLGNQYAAAVAYQQTVVDKWSDSLDAANKTLDDQNKALDTLQANLDALQDQYNAASDAMQNYAQAPIKGMGAMDDAIFANQMAQKKLQLQMMDYEKVHGPIRDVQDQFAALQGQIENLLGTAADLRSKGAGSEILGPIDKQIADLKKQQQSLSTNSSPYQKMQDQLQALQDQADRMDLEKSLKFDPLTHQIEKLSDTTKELSFDEIVAGIKKSKDTMSQLTPKIDAAKKAVDKQTAAIKVQTAIRDKIQSRYDAESKKLDQLKDQYNQITQAIQDVTSALDDMAAAAKQASDAAGSAGLSAGAQNFEDAAGGNFDIPGGDAGIGREGGLTDQSFNIDQFTKDLNKQLADSLNMGDMFAPIKDAWNKTWDWIVKNLGGPLGKIWDGIKQFFGSLGGLFEGLDFGAAFSKAWDKAKPVLSAIWDPIKKAWDAIWPSLKNAFKGAVDGLKKAWDAIWPSLQKLWATLGPLVKSMLPALLTILGMIGATILGIIGGISGALGPAIETIGRVIADVVKAISGIIKVITGIFDVVWGVVQAIIGFFKGIFTGDWKMFKDGIAKIWKGIQEIFHGVVDFFAGIGEAIWDALWGILKTVWGFVSGAVKAVWDGVKSFASGFAKKAESIFKGVIDWFKKLPGRALDWGLNLVKGLWHGIQNGANWLWTQISNFFKWLVDKVKDFLGIHSPSTVFADIGIDIVKGLWNGILSLGSLLLQAGEWILNQIWTGIKNVATTVWDWFKNVGTWIWDRIVKLNAMLLNVGKSVLTWIWDGIKGIADTVWNWFKNVGNWIWNRIKGLASAITGFGKNIITWIWNGIKAVATSVWNWFKDIGTWIGNVVAKVWGTFVTIGKNVLGKIKDGFVAVGTSVWNWFKDIGTWIGNVVSGVWESVKTVGKNVLGKIKEGFIAVGQGVWNWFKDIGTWISDVVQGAYDTISAIGKHIINWIVTTATNTARGAWNFLKDIGTWIGDGIQLAWSTIMGWGKKIIGWIGDGIRAAASGIAQAVSDAVTSVNLGPVLGGKLHGIIPGFATGGQLTSGVTSIVGEHGPELINWKSGRVYTNMQSRAMLAAQKRLDASASASLYASGAPVTNNISQPTYVTFTGDLSFPNVKGGEDADKFLSNVSFLARSGQ